MLKEREMRKKNQRERGGGRQRDKRRYSANSAIAREKIKKAKENKGNRRQRRGQRRKSVSESDNSEQEKRMLDSEKKRQRVREPKRGRSLIVFWGFPAPPPFSQLCDGMGKRADDAAAFCCRAEKKLCMGSVAAPPPTALFSPTPQFSNSGSSDCGNPIFMASQNGQKWQ